MTKMSSYNKIIITTVVISVIIIVALVFIERYFHSQIEETRIQQYQGQQILIAHQTASSLNDFMEHVKLELISLSLTSPKGSDYKLDKSLFSNYHRSLIESISAIVRIDENSKLVKKTGEEFLSYAYGDFSNQDFFTVPRNTEDTYVSEIQNEVNQKRYLVVSIPVFRTRQYTAESRSVFDGVLLALIDIDLIEELYLNQIKIGLNGYMWAVRTDGTLLTESREPEFTIQKGDDYFDWVKQNYPRNSNNINKMIVENTGSFVDDWGSYGKTLTSYSHVFFGGSGWIIGVTTPYSELMEGIQSLQQRMLSFLVASVSILSITFVFILLILRSKEKTEEKLEKAEITLEKLGIKGITEYSAKNGLDIELKENKIYLIKESYHKNSFDMFISLLNKGYVGLAIIRNNPDEIKKLYKLEKTPFIWLKKPKDEKDKLSMVDTSDLLKITCEFVEKNKNSIVLVERLDYIIVQNGFEKTLKFIHSLKDALINDSIIIISINPNTLTGSQLVSIEEEAQDISSLIRKEKPKLPKDIYEILEFINNRNSENRTVVFKNISREFNITKPTTKKKLIELEKLGFIEIEEHGRVKSLSVTDKGSEFLEE